MYIVDGTQSPSCKLNFNDFVYRAKHTAYTVHVRFKCLAGGGTSSLWLIDFRTYYTMHLLILTIRCLCTLARCSHSAMQKRIWQNVNMASHLCTFVLTLRCDVRDGLALADIDLQDYGEISFVVMLDAQTHVIFSLQMTGCNEKLTELLAKSFLDKNSILQQQKTREHRMTYDL